MLISSGEEERLVTEAAMPSSDGIGIDRAVRVPEVGHVVDIEDRGRDVEAAHLLRLPAAAGGTDLGTHAMPLASS